MKRIFAILVILLVFAISSKVYSQTDLEVIKKIKIKGLKDSTIKVNENETFKIDIIADSPFYKMKGSKIVFSFDKNNKFDFDSTKEYSIKNLAFIKIISPVRDSTNKKDSLVIITFLKEADNGDTTLHNSNFVSASFIKSIAGSNVPNNEFLDIFVKLNIGSQKKFFTLLGADVGLGGDSTNKSQPFRFNEAIANFNYSIYRRKQVKLPWKSTKLFNMQFKNKFGADSSITATNYSKYLESFLSADSLFKKSRDIRDSLSNINVNFYDKLRRTAFVGLGLKIFYNEAYIGTHIGILEINGHLFGSYVFGGYYLNTYRLKLSGSDTLNQTNTNSGYSFNYYRHNIYFEAGLNILSGTTNQLSSFFNSIRFKFGLMLPMGINESITPKSKDIISRLAVEVPLGIKRF